MKPAALTISVIIALCAGSVWGQASEPLTHDPSRAQLFDLMRSYLQDQAKPEDKRLYALPSSFNFPHDALWKNPVVDLDPRPDQLFGIDLSHHNVDSCHCQIDWGQLWQQKVRFAYLKASQGVKGIDPRFDTYRNGARSMPSPNKIYVGPYHFLSATGSGESQATHFLAVIDRKLAVDDLPPTLDLEWDIRTDSNGKLILGVNGKPRDFWDQLDGEEILTRALGWLATVAQKTGRTPIVYTNHAWWRQRIGADSKISALAKYPVWISDYSLSGLALEKPSLPGGGAWILWQFTSNAQFSIVAIGTGRTVDANVFNGALADFRSAMGLPQ